MAVVGSAYVVVRALTDRVEADIQKGFKGANVSARNAGRSMGAALTNGLNKGTASQKLNALADSLRSLAPGAEEASRGFTKLVRRGYVVQGAVGSIVGSIATLVGGLGALIGSIGAAVPALFTLASAGLSVVAAMKIVSFSLGGIGAAVKNATDPTKALGSSVEDLTKKYEDLRWAAEEAALSENSAALDLEKAREGLMRTADLAPNSIVRREAQQAFAEAEFAYRKAIANREDLNKKVNDGVGSLGGGVSDPFAGLTASQKAFAEFLVYLDGIQDDLKESAASGFLPILEEQMSRLINSGVITLLEDRFYDLGVAAGEAFGNFNDVILANGTLGKLDTFMKDMADYIPSFGFILGNSFDAFLTIMNEVDPVTRRFIGWLETKTNSFASFLDTKAASGELETFFTQAGDNAAKLGSIFGNTFDGLVNIISTNFSPGSGGWMIMDWLDMITGTWRDVDKVFLESYFIGSADNFIAMGNSIGGAIETIIRMASNPAVGEFWRTLDSGSYAFDQFIRASVETAPAFAEILQTLGSIIASFTDASVPSTFFNTLNVVLEAVNVLMIALKPILDSFIGQAMAIASALGLISITLQSIGTIGAGFIIRALTPLASLLGLTVATGGAATAATVSISAMGTAIYAAMAPLLPVLLPIAAIIGGITALFIAHGDNAEKAMKQAGKAMEDGADAATVWDKAILSSIKGPWKQQIDSVDKMKEGMSRLTKAQKDWTYALPSTTAIADAFGAIGKSLANIAVTDLPRAQDQFKKFTTEVGFSNVEIVTALNEMDEYKNALIDQADQMAINIRTTEGEIDMRKLANFAVGEGEIAIRKHKEEMSQAAQKSGELARAEKTRIQGLLDDFVDYREGLNQNKEDLKTWAQAQADDSKDATDTWEDYYDDQKFNLDVYLQGLEDQIKAQQSWKDNLALLAQQLPDEVYKEVENMGEAGADLVAALVEGSEQDRQRLIDSFNTAGKQAGSGLGTGIKTGLNEALASFKITIPGQISTDARRAMKKDGGFISNFKNGGMAKFGFGGFVSGAGTARSDSIPAMLSNGEYVVNARATAANRQLLEEINSNKKVGQGSTVNMVINPSPGMDERKLADMVSKKIAYQIRRGAI